MYLLSGIKLPEFARFMFLHGGWLALGLLVYFLLMSIKVFILTSIQPAILAYTVSDKKPFEHFFRKWIRQLATTTAIWKSTWVYIFRYRKSDWVEIDNKPVKIRLSIIKKLAIWLQPFIVCAVIFLLLRWSIASKLFYDPLSETLGAIQEKLVFIGHFHFIAVFISLKALVILIYCVVTILVIARITKERLDSGKTYLTNFIAYLSIFLNVSFFYTGVSNQLKAKQMSLTKLGLNIVETHNRIYIETATAVTEEIIRDDLKKRAEVYAQQATLLDKQIKDFDTIAVRSDIRDTLRIHVASYVKRLIDTVTLAGPDGDFPPPDKAHLLEHTLAAAKSGAEFMEANFPAGTNDFMLSPDGTGINNNLSSPAETINKLYEEKIKTSAPVDETNNFEQYFEKRENWNMQTGASMLKQLGMGKTIKDSFLKSDRAKWIIESVFAYGLDFTAGKFLERCKTAPTVAIKKLITSILDPAFKDCVVKKTVSILSKLKFGKLFNFTSECKLNETDKKEKIDETLRAQSKTFVQDGIQAAHNAQKEVDRLHDKEVRDALAKQQNAKNKFQSLAAELSATLQKRSWDIPGKKQIAAAVENLDMSDPITILWKQSIESDNGYNNKIPFDRNIQHLFNAANLASAKTKLIGNLKKYMVVKPTDGDWVNANETLLQNIGLVNDSKSLSKIVTTLKDRDNIAEADFKIAFPLVCGCCGLPMECPCLCRLRL